MRGRGRLSDADIDEIAREIRLALLEADVNVRVVKDFISRIKERASGAEVAKSLTPAQQVIKIVHEELVATLGSTTVELVSLEGTGEHAVLRYLVTPAKSKVTLTIDADNESLPELEAEYDRETGEGSVTLFPLLRAHNALAITARTSKTNEATTTLVLD